MHVAYRGRLRLPVLLAGTDVILCDKVQQCMGSAAQVRHGIAPTFDGAGRWTKRHHEPADVAHYAQWQVDTGLVVLLLLNSRRAATCRGPSWQGTPAWWP